MTTEKLGRTTSFYQLMKEPGFRIEIPKIQRDYAQGRESAKNLRTNFLRTIKKHLDEKVNLNLDFVYGSIDGDKFIPIDGQQRLTTLFLIHWYLGWASDNQNDFKGYLITENPEASELLNDSRFTYETRISSRDFCNKLLGTEILAVPGILISKIIRNQTWFYLHWKQDASIMAMLNTLDSIESIFDDPSKYYQLLLDDSNLITFQYIQLDDFGLTDQLYIKMNSRGKPLTEFENLKANVEGIFKQSDLINKTELSSWFSKNVDKQWTDLFWAYRVEGKKTHHIDDLFMNFIRNCITYIAVLEKDKTEVRQLLDASKAFNFYFLQSIDCANSSIFQRTFEILDKLCSKDGKLYKYLSNTDILDEKSLFKDAINNDISYVSRIQFAAFVGFVIQHDDHTGIDEWMRLVRNLSENSRIEEIEEYTNAIKTVNKFLPQSQDIIDHIKGLKPGDFVGFSNDQAIEEIYKAQLFTDDPICWKERIKKIENHPYLKGNILFILLSSGLISKNEDGKYDENMDSNLTETFDSYVHKLESILKSNGIREFDGFLFRRALLSVDDYTLRKGRNYSFVINGYERDISWKRLLRSDLSSPLKELLDDIDVSNLENDLKKKVNSFKDKNDWRYYFIKYPEMIGNTGTNYLIRWNSENEIYLLTKTQMNGMHYEYYSYAVFLELKNLGFRVEYELASVEELGSKHISSINDKEILISFWPYDPDNEKEKPGFWIEFEEEGIQEKIDSISEVLDWFENYFKN